MDVILKPCDLFFTRGRGLLPWAVRFFTRSIGEERTVINHVGVVVTEGTLRTAEVIEALMTVRWHRLWERYGPPERGSFVIHRSTKPWEFEVWKWHGPPKKDLVALYRPTNLTQEEVDRIVNYVKEQVGKPYGFWRLVAHLLDWLLCGRYYFRRCAEDGRYHICSWLVAHAFEEAGKTFDVEAGGAQPDDIWDFVRENPDKYSLVVPLKPLS